MSTERPGPTESPTPTPDAEPAPILSLRDPRAIQILSTEHWSVLTARSLAYNEAFTRAGMFLSFLSMSFVGLALLADAAGFTGQLLGLAAIVLGFDFVVGLTTFSRVSGANFDDLRALHGMARVRHGYVQAAPMLKPYFTTATNDDIPTVLLDYAAPESFLGGIAYGLSSSLGMMGLVLSMLGGVEVGVLGLLLGADTTTAVLLGVAAAPLILLALIGATLIRIRRSWTLLQARFPSTPPSPEPPAAEAVAD
ncbi:MAG TPA: hypothetical protein VFK61_05500 [Candidatus Limnocylindria bacterium]|jgi:hypothetical protein|nr:hypothetical protein [Candidatus Limnocylindria bacterium]